MGATQGKPVVRPLFWDFLEDDETHSDEDAVENQIMLGDAVLVRGICKPMSEVGESATVYLPKNPGGWYDLYTGDFYSPGKKINEGGHEDHPSVLQGRRHRAIEI